MSLVLLKLPYRKVKEKQVSDDVIYMNAHEEDNYIIAQANAFTREKRGVSK